MPTKDVNSNSKQASTLQEEGTDAGQSAWSAKIRIRHARQKTSTLHVLVFVEEWNEDPQLSFECTDHGQRFCYYDTQCSKLVCRDCLLLSHQSHLCASIPVAAAETKDKLRGLVNEAQTLAERHAAQISKISQTRRVVEGTCSAAATEVRTYFDKVRKTTVFFLCLLLLRKEIKKK